MVTGEEEIRPTRAVLVERCHQGAEDNFNSAYPWEREPGLPIESNSLSVLRAKSCITNTDVGDLHHSRLDYPFALSQDPRRFQSRSDGRRCITTKRTHCYQRKDVTIEDGGKIKANASAISRESLE